MKYGKIVEGKFIDRPNRFIAHVEIAGKAETVHVKNTGRCRELLLPGAAVRLEQSDNPARKTLYDLVAVYKDRIGWINIDSQASNKVVKEWLEAQDYDVVRPEYTYGNSRIDFYLEKGEHKIIMEVKGCTLEINGIGYFPDAPTERGVKHLRELAAARQEGYECDGCLCDSDGRSDGSTSLCGNAAGIWYRSGGSRGRWGEGVVFAMQGG